MYFQLSKFVTSNIILNCLFDFSTYRNAFDCNYRSHENDRAASLIEAVRSYVGENNFNNLNQENSSLSGTSAGVTGGGGVMRTVSTLCLRNGLVETNNNNEKHVQETRDLDTCGESNDTDVSQNSFNSSDNGNVE